MRPKKTVQHKRITRKHVKSPRMSMKINDRAKRKPIKRRVVKGELWAQRAIKAGFMSASQAQGETSLSHMQTSMTAWYQSQEHIPSQPREVISIAQAFRKGYVLAAKLITSYIPLPMRTSSSAIVCASNEELTLPLVIAQLKRLPLSEIIIILNGCHDRSYASIDKDERITIVHYKQRLGHDVGRAIGAKLATGDTLLFVDGDLTVKAEDLAHFMLTVDQGIDVALNDLTPYLPKFMHQDQVTRIKTFLNVVLGRRDLYANSLTAVPHALSRVAISQVGIPALMVPPKAQALAIVKGLKVSAPISVDVVKGNRIRVGNTGQGNAVAKLIVGDHLEALDEVMKLSGIRLKVATLPRHELAKVRNQR